MMKHHSLRNRAARGVILALALAGLAGCASSSGGGTASLQDSGAVQGRDLGRGGATAGGISSQDRGDNNADFSVYDARQLEAQQHE